MSFILDALRKSEDQRREQSAPALASAPRTAAPGKKSIWLPILVIALAINALVIGYVLLMRDADPAAGAAVTAPAPTDGAVRSLRKEASIEAGQRSPTIAASRPTVAPGPAARSAPAANPAPAAPSAAAAGTTRKSSIREGLPSLDQLRAGGLLSISDLRVDMHVYAGDADKRFVFINMKKYREGDRLLEGPTVEEITPDGVIMRHESHRFGLDRD